ncbi:uncharacterized protein DS421_4g126120 [Arachis hypogaea]|uniref:Uncharacterized protein n=1 Tax=Arachis hypogaea TaxID=3818 RepID=A0A445DF04_ARAHY|nr:uncharacterized protein DS421_4g126120 [Arachis hypogaea]RYR61757.1 hypothetical protein Ahy_A04g018961 isoform A [Arachis hypogaea]
MLISLRRQKVVSELLVALPSLPSSSSPDLSSSSSSDLSSSSSVHSCCSPVFCSPVFGVSSSLIGFRVIIVCPLLSSEISIKLRVAYATEISTRFVLSLFIRHPFSTTLPPR